MERGAPKPLPNVRAAACPASYSALRAFVSGADFVCIVGSGQSCVRWVGDSRRGGPEDGGDVAAAPREKGLPGS